MSETYEFLKQCDSFFLTTINGSVPAARPFGAIMEYEKELYFSTSNTKEVYSQLIANPSIQIVAIKIGTREWIRINGKAIEINNLYLKQIMLDVCPVLLKRFETKECHYFSLFKVSEMESSLYIGGDRRVIKDIFDLALVEPNKELQEQAMEYRQEYLEYDEKHIHGSCGFLHYDNYDEWLKKVNETQNASTSFLKVPATTYFSIRKSDNKIIGTIQLRHYLTEELKKSGGHIGYGIRPSERKKGYGTQQLSLILEKTNELKISRVMISCDKDNISSKKVAINNGGVLEWEGFDEENGEIQIYWIDLQ